MKVFQFFRSRQWQMILVICMMVPLVSHAFSPDDSSDFSLGWEAYDNGNYETALKVWKPLANNGHVQAQVNLGIMYDYGRGVTEDKLAAAQWYRAAAQQGNMSAQYNLGQMYAQGRGLSKDKKSALKWYTKAAEQGLVIAQYNLGIMYDKGTGTSKDKHESLNWFYKAGLGFIEKGDNNRANKALIAIKTLFPEHKYVGELEQKLGKLSNGTQHKASLETAPSISSGTAWPIAYGYAVTNNHVVEGIDTVKLLNVNGEEISATVVLRDKHNDLALLSVRDVDKLPPALPLSANVAGLGAHVFTIGYPRIDIMGKSPKLTDGIISSVNGMRGDIHSYQISVPIQPGNSGGPLLNMHGEVVGIVTSMLGTKTSGSTYFLPNISYALKVDVLKQLIRQLPNQEADLGELPYGPDNLEGLAARIHRSVLIVMASSHKINSVRLD